MSFRERQRMVVDQLEARGIRDRRVLDAMGEVPRERFVPVSLRDVAYADRALPLSEGQTISQPYMVARTCELASLAPSAKVLDVGTGSGYQAAVLAAMGVEVVSIECLPLLAASASRVLSELGYHVHVVVGDGTLGWPDGAPYDAIVCAASAPDIPPSWKRQLRVGGRAVLPIGSRSLQDLTVVERTGEDRFEHSKHGACVYVPLVGDEGWSR